MTVPVSLALLALTDACFAGFRAATGRNALIRKGTYFLRAAGRGVVLGAVGLGLVALLLGLSLDSASRYAELEAAGTRMLHVLLPYAAVVAASIVAYWVLPMRGSTFVILVGLGPFTLARPAIVATAVAWAVAGSSDWLVWTGSTAAGASVLAVGPLSHRIWYR